MIFVLDTYLRTLDHLNYVNVNVVRGRLSKKLH